MVRKPNWRLLFAMTLLASLGAWVLAREHRPSLLRPDLRLYAYVANTGDGTLTVIDLAALRAVNTIVVGPAPSGLRAHPTRDEIWGVSTTGSYVWVLDAPTGEVAARIAIGEGAFALDFSPDGRWAYVAASRSGTVSVLDCESRRVLTTVRVGREPWVARVTPDGRTVVVPNRGENTVTLLDAETMESLARIPVAQRPEQVMILPDSSKAFISSGREGSRDGGPSGLVSVVDLHTPTRGGLLANLNLGARVADFMLKPDGGELYVSTPERNGLVILNTWTNEVAENLVVGSQPTYGTLAQDSTLYLSDAASGQIRPITMEFRRLQRPIPAGRQPGLSRLTPGEDLLLVVNQESDDVAVIRTRTQSLLTMIPVGPSPRDLAVKLFRSN